jgi:hypothetical protein
MERSLVILALALIFVTAGISCRRSGAERLSAGQVNPYRGAVRDILPQQSGDFMLVQASSLEQIEEDDIVNHRDGVGAIYNSSNNHTVQHLLVAFNSAGDAAKELDSAEKRYAEAHMKYRSEEVKDQQGQTVGRRLVVNDGKTEAMNWTDGSLYCTAVSYTGYSSEFAKNLPY